MPTPEKEIIKAAKSGNTARIKELIALDPKLIGALDSDGSTPLHCAVWKGQREAVSLLLELGAEVNAHNNNDHWGTTPLHAAAHANETAIAEKLIAHGADLKAKDMEGRTPLDHTTFHKAKAVARLLENSLSAKT
jgi:ankyrin repeat protein